MKNTILKECSNQESGANGVLENQIMFITEL